MKKLVWLVGALCATAAGLLVWGPRRMPIEDLAHQLETAWSDHHTTP